MNTINYSFGAAKNWTPKTVQEYKRGSLCCKSNGFKHRHASMPARQTANGQHRLAQGRMTGPMSIYLGEPG
eukprot:4121663-Amphidinium_carterae.1